MRKPFMVEFSGTPEAGKTTSIKLVAEAIKSQGYSVRTLKESAESLPEEIPKGTWHANLWMHYLTQAGVLKAQFFDADIVLIDRGLIDSNFYGKKFLWEKVCNEDEYKKFRSQFLNDLFPNLFIALIVPPETSIERRGGEGRLVTLDYVRKYNTEFLKYFNEVTTPKHIMDTSKMSVEEMTEAIKDVIIKKLP